VNLSDILEPTRVSDREFSVSMPEGWTQGRGAFGGLVLGSLLRCIELAEPDGNRTLRSLTAEIAGPVLPGTWKVVVETLRRGNAVSTVRASIVSEEEVLADMVAVLGRPRPGMPQWQTKAAPVMEPWRHLEPAPLGPPFAPVFTQHLEYRVVGALPFGGGSEAIASGWVRPREPCPSRGAAYVVAMVDAWWPACAIRFDEPRPLATITFSLQLVGSLEGLNAEAPLFHSATAPVAHDGYTVEFRELWGEDGRLVALNQQTIAIIK